MKTYYNVSTGWLECFLEDENEQSYAEYLGPNDEITVFLSEKTNEVVGYALEDIGDMAWLDLSLEDRLAIFMKRLRVISGMTQKDFVEHLNISAKDDFVSYRNYQRIEASDNSGSIGLHFLSVVSSLYPKENWEVLFSKESFDKTA